MMIPFIAVTMTMSSYLTKINVQDGSEEVLLEDEVLNLYIEEDILYYETIDGAQHQENL